MAYYSTCFMVVYLGWRVKHEILEWVLDTSADQTLVPALPLTS